jgi:hypothetical protein
MLLCASASAATITFSGLAGANGDPLTTPYTEAGFTVNTTAGEFFQAQQFGNPIPSLFAGLIGGGPTTDTLDVTGGSFTFASVDLAANNGDVDFTFTGSLSGVQKYSVSGVEPGRFGPFGFDTISNPDADITIDDLKITLHILGSSGNIDNIVLNSVVSTVPLPAAPPLFATGLGLLGLLGWRRKRKAAPLNA